MDQEPCIVGRNVRRLREARGMSGNALAQAAGLRQGHLWGLETGRKRNPSVHVAAALARALGCTVDDLLRLEPVEVPILAAVADEAAARGDQKAARQARQALPEARRLRDAKARRAGPGMG